MIGVGMDQTLQKWVSQPLASWQELIYARFNSLSDQQTTLSFMRRLGVQKYTNLAWFLGLSPSSFSWLQTWPLNCLEEQEKLGLSPASPCSSKVTCGQEKGAEDSLGVRLKPTQIELQLIIWTVGDMSIILLIMDNLSHCKHLNVSSVFLYNSSTDISGCTNSPTPLRCLLCHTALSLSASGTLQLSLTLTSKFYPVCWFINPA